MNIAIISTVGGGYSWAGSEEMWRVIAEASLAKGHSVNVSLVASMAQATQLHSLTTLGAKIFPRCDLNTFTRRMAQKGLYSRFWNFSHSKDNVTILSMGAIADCIWMPDLLNFYWKSHIPWIVIVQANGDYINSDESQRDLLRRFYSKARRVVFVSQQNLNLAERQLACSFTNACVIPNPLRTQISDPLAWNSSTGPTKRFACVARFEVFQKRQDNLLEALASEEWRSRPWVLSFYGSGPDENHIRKLVKHFALETKVEFAGYVRDFCDIWKENHIHILPSAYEGLALSLIESMYCGRPALVTHAGGNAELIRNGIDGFVSPGTEPTILRETLEEAWTQRDRWQEMGLAAFTRVEAFLPKDWSSQMLDLVEAMGAEPTVAL